MYVLEPFFLLFYNKLHNFYIFLLYHKSNRLYIFFAKNLSFRLQNRKNQFIIKMLLFIIVLKNKENLMEQIASFTINHLKLLPGIYVSRKDTIGKEVITTFDIRMTRPNFEPVMNTAEIHTIEHLAATFLRNHKEYGSKTVYFGPMGCRTGFYVIFAGDLSSKDIVPIITELFTFIRDFEGNVPGAAAIECGNYLDMNLPMAKYLAKKYLNEVLENIGEDRLIYPE